MHGAHVNDTLYQNHWNVVLLLLKSGRNQVELFWTGDQREGMQSDTPLMHIGNDILEAIFDEGLRVTHARRCIAECLETLAATDVNFTIEGLYIMAHVRDHHVGRATIYRTVETLVRLELVDRITFADDVHYYRVSGRNHHHYITCTHCRRVATFDFCAPQGLFARVADDTGFVIEGHAFDFFGLCPDCARHRQ
jgi:Fe2+ or Zn2+ uptake regulation protein